MKYGIESCEVIVGCNPEFADMGNPRGNIYGIVYYAVCYTDNGEVFVYRNCGSEIEAIEDCIFLEENGFIPETFYRYVYGSKGWIAEEPFIAQREREDEIRGFC